MLRRTVAITLLAVCLAFCLGGSPAMADQILGDWCPPDGGQSLSVKNYDDVTYNGKAVKANVNRHHVDFTIPEGEIDAGLHFNADQLNDEQIRVTVGRKASILWRPCKPVS